MEKISRIRVDCRWRGSKDAKVTRDERARDAFKDGELRIMAIQSVGQGNKTAKVPQISFPVANFKSKFAIKSPSIDSIFSRS